MKNIALAILAVGFMYFVSETDDEFIPQKSLLGAISLTAAIATFIV